MHSIRQAGGGYVARDLAWLQRGTRLGRGVSYAVTATNAYTTIRKIIEDRDPGLEPSTVDFAVGFAAALEASFRGRLGATYLPLRFDKPISRAMASVYVQTDVVQPVQTAGRGRPVPEMLCGTADAVDPELTQSEFTPPEESGPPPAPPRVSRVQEYQKRGYKTGRRMQSAIRRPERPVLDPPISELQSKTPTQAPEEVTKAASEELWDYKIPKRRRRTPSPSSSSNSDESTSGQSQKSESLPRRRAESYESIMPKLTRETVAAPIPHEKSGRRKRGRAGKRTQRSIEAKEAVEEYRKKLKRRCGDNDVRDAVKQLTEEIRRDRADHSRGVGQVSDSLSRHREDAVGDYARAHVTSGARHVDRRRGPVESESRDREPQKSRWSQSGWRIGGGRRGGTRHGARR